MNALFWSNVDKTSGCWLWTGSTNGCGYGQFTYNGKLEKAHRVSWQIHHGPLPLWSGHTTGICVLHRCDVPLCVNPDHLFLGTQGDNVADMIEKGRRDAQQFASLGGKARAAKLTKARRIAIAKKAAAARWGKKKP